MDICEDGKVCGGGDHGDDNKICGCKGTKGSGQGKVLNVHDCGDELMNAMRRR